MRVTFTLRNCLNHLIASQASEGTLCCRWRIGEAWTGWCQGHLSSPPHPPAPSVAECFASRGSSPDTSGPTPERSLIYALTALIVVAGKLMWRSTARGNIALHTQKMHLGITWDPGNLKAISPKNCNTPRIFFSFSATYLGSVVDNEYYRISTMSILFIYYYLFCLFIIRCGKS